MASFQLYVLQLKKKQKTKHPNKNDSKNPYRVQLKLPVWVWGHPHRQPSNGHIPRENWLFLLYQPVATNSSSARDGTCEPLPHLCWSCAGLLFCRPCAGKHSWYEFMRAIAMSYPKDIAQHPCCSLALTSFLLILCHVPGALGWGSWYWCPVYGWALSLLLAFWPVMSLHWLLPTVSLARVKKSITNLWLLWGACPHFFPRGILKQGEVRNM